MQDQFDVYFFCAASWFIFCVQFLLVLFQFFVSKDTHAILFCVCYTIFYLLNFKTVILNSRKVFKAIYNVEAWHNFSLELVFVNSEWGHLIALHILNIGRSIVSLDFLLHFLQINVAEVIVHLDFNLVETYWPVRNTLVLDLMLLLVHRSRHRNAGILVSHDRDVLLNSTIKSIFRIVNNTFVLASLK